MSGTEDVPHTRPTVKDSKIADLLIGVAVILFWLAVGFFFLYLADDRNFM